MPRLRTAAMSLAELLTYCLKYTVPDYQRVYAWGEDQIDRLLSDLDTGNGTSWLYFGTIYLAGEPDRRRAEIADGQQRILTVSLLYAAGRDLAENADEAAKLHAMLVASEGGRSGKPAFRFSPRDSDAAFFREWVQEPESTLRPYAVDGQGGEEAPEERSAGDDAREGGEATYSESRRHIIANRDAIVAKLRALGDAGRRRLFEILEKSTEVVVITAPTLDEARNAYASTQSRGLAQAATDKLKAELLGDVAEGVRGRLASHWENCEADLGRDHFAELFQHLIVMESGRKPQHALEVDLTSVFGLPKRIEPFIEQTLLPAAAAYARLLSSQASRGKLQGTTPERRRQRRINGHLISLLRISHAAWKAPALVALRDMSGEPEALVAFLRDLERLAAGMMIIGTDPNKTIERYVTVIRDLKAKRAASSPALDFTAAELARILECLRDARFGQRERFRMPVLLKLNDLLGGAVEAIDAKSVSCEHVLPRNPPDRSPWRGLFRTADRTRYDGGSYVNTLGNLAILSHEDNRLADTHPFAAVKRKILKNSAYALANDAAEAKAWTPEIVKQRTARLVDLLIEHWRLQGG